jgi:ribosome maturation factor RimP
MNLPEQNIRDAVEQVVKDNGFFLIDINVRGSAKNKIIEVFVDGESYISAEDCAKVGRELNSVIQRGLLVDSDFRLEVSSPGIDRPLKFLKQFPKHLNRTFEVTYKQKDIEEKKIIGKLAAIEGDNLIFSVKNSDLVINFNDIIKAKVQISFS